MSLCITPDCPGDILRRGRCSHAACTHPDNPPVRPLSRSQREFLVRLAHWSRGGMDYSGPRDQRMNALADRGLAYWSPNYGRYGKHTWHLTNAGRALAAELGAELRVPDDYDERLARGEYD